MESSKGCTNWRCATHLTSSRVAVLQYRLQELSERERRARNHNQKLLQDFQRAQNTLSDLVARTEAMNTIRLEYERYLEENYPKWQQKLQDKRLSEQRKMIEEHLNASTPQTEEEGQRIDRGSKQNMQGNIQNSIHSSFPSMWLTQSQPAVTESEHSNISKKTKNIQNVQQSLNSSLLDRSLLSGDPLHSLYSIVPQNPPSYEHLRQYPNPWASGSGRFKLRVHCPTDCPSWSHLPLINVDKERREEEGRQKKRQEASSNSRGENPHMQKQRKKVNRSGTKPVSISDDYGDTSESSDLSSEAVKSLPTEVQRRRNKRREEKQPHNTRKDAVSQGSSSISDSRSVPNPKKRNQQSNQRRTAFKTSKVAVDSPEQLVKENKDEGNAIKETLTSISCAVETKGMQRYEKKDETEEEEAILSTGEKEVNGVANRHLAENQEKRASLCEEQGKEGEVGERYAEQSSTTEEEAQDDEVLRSNTSGKESLLEEESVKESEAEEGGVGEEEDEDGEKRDEDEESRVSGRGSKEDDNESYQEGNDNEVLASGSETSERNMQDSLRELYKDETEDDLAEKEANIEDDDDDDVIVEKASAWSCPVFEDTKYQDDDDDDDDDIEGLLAPQNKSLQHQADEPEEILKSKGLHSDSEENARGKDEPVGSGDEFDRFYD